MPDHGHAAADRRNLHLHHAAFAKLRADAGLRRPCIELVERWLADPALESASPWLREWHTMLVDWPVERMEAAVLAGDAGQVLRQCSPLGPVVTPQERGAVLAEVDRRVAAGEQAPAAS